MAANIKQRKEPSNKKLLNNTIIKKTLLEYMFENGNFQSRYSKRLKQIILIA
jgi:hypothetical protein